MSVTANACQSVILILDVLLLQYLPYKHDGFASFSVSNKVKEMANLHPKNGGGGFMSGWKREVERKSKEKKK